MSNSSKGMKSLMALVCLIVAAYFGMQVYQYYHDPLSTTVAYTYEVEESDPASGFLVRDEQVLSGGDSGLMRISRTEGEKVSKGGKIAVVYADQASLDRQNQIDSLETQISQLQYAQEASLGSEASLKLDNQIRACVLKLQDTLISDRLDSADSMISQLRALVLKRDYTYAGDGDASAEIKDLQTQLQKLSSQTASSTKTVTAPESGTFSAVVDGYETVLTPAMLTGITPSAISSAAADATVTSSLGKLILGSTWYYAAVIDASDAEHYSAGSSVKLRFTKGADRDLAATVQSVSQPENGQVAVVFSSSQYLSEVTLLRQQSADVIRKTTSGIRVPSAALRVNRDGTAGVYCVVGMTAKFKPVRVIYDGDEFSLVAASNPKSETARLRVGDEVIVTAKALYDGKVVS